MTVQKVLHSSLLDKDPPKITSQKMWIKEKFLYVPPHRKGGILPRSAEDSWWRGGGGAGAGRAGHAEGADVTGGEQARRDMDTRRPPRTHRRLPGGGAMARRARSQPHPNPASGGGAATTQQEEKEEPRHPQPEEQTHPQQEEREGPQEREEPEQPEEQEEERRLREQEEGRVLVRELVRTTIGGGGSRNASERGSGRP